MLHYDSNAREGDPVIVASGPYTIRAHGSLAGAETRLGLLRGGHGFDPKVVPEMKAIFFAEGPDVRTGVTLPVFENVNVYPFVGGMLGLKMGTLDGKIEDMQAAIPGQEALPRRIGGSVKPPVLIHAEEPVYTPQASEARTEGYFMVDLWVEPDGSPSHIRALRSRGKGMDTEALRVMKKYRFKPATENGVPVTVRITIENNTDSF